MKKTLYVLGIISVAFALLGQSVALAADGGPTATISSTLTSPTNTATIPVTVTFSSPVSGFTAASVQVSGPAALDAGSFNGSDAQYSFTLQATVDGIITVTIPADIATDTNNLGNQSAQFTISYNVQNPHIELSPSPLPSQVSEPFSVTVKFTTQVVDFTADKITVVGGSASDLAATSPTNTDFTFTVTPTPGPLSISIGANVVHSAAGNGNAPSNLLQTRMGPVQLSGTVMQDSDVSSSQSAADAALSNWTVIASPINSDGTPDASRVAISTTTDSNGNYSFAFDNSQFGRWAITPQISGQFIATYGGNSTFTAAIDSQTSSVINFGYAAYITAGNGILLPINGTADSAESFVTLPGTTTTIAIGLVAGTSTIYIPPSTHISNQDGTRVNLDNLVKQISTSQAGSNIVTSRIIRWGLHAMGLVYDNPVTFSLAVPGNEGIELSVFRSEGINQPWKGGGILPPGTCIVVGGVCTFQATISPLNPLSPIASLSSIAPKITTSSITSNNPNTSLARVGNVITLTFSASTAVQSPVVTIAGHSVAAATTTAATNSFSAAYTLTAADSEGVIPFTIAVTDLNGYMINNPATSTTDGTSVLFSKTGPSLTLGSLPALSNKASLPITFSTSAPATFECAVSKTTPTTYAACASPYTINAPDGTYRFYLHAIDAAGNITATSSAPFTFDRVAPALAVVATPPTLNKVATPTYQFTSSEAGTVQLTGACTAASLPSVVATLTNTIKMGPLTDGVYGNCSIRVTDAAGNVSVALSIAKFTIDTKVPTLAVVSAPNTIDNNPSPWFQYTSDTAGTVQLSGLCTAATLPNARVGVTNTIKMGPLVDGLYNNCSVRVTDAAGNISKALLIPRFTVDTKVPTLTMVSAPNPLDNDTSPVFQFTSDTAGAVQLGGVCTAAALPPVRVGVTTIIRMGPLADGVYGNCSVRVTDAAGNVSKALVISKFTVDTKVPTATFKATKVGTLVHVVVTFSKSVTGVASNDFAVTNGALKTFTATSATVYAFDIAPTTGTIGITLRTGAAIDAAGNKNTATTFSFKP